MINTLDNLEVLGYNRRVPPKETTTMTTSTARFTVNSFSESWGSYESALAAKHGCEFVSEGASDLGDEYFSITMVASSVGAAEGFVTEMFGCDEYCTAEELIDWA